MQIFIDQLKALVGRIEGQNPNFEKIWQLANENFVSWTNRLTEHTGLRWTPLLGQQGG